MPLWKTLMSSQAIGREAVQIHQNNTLKTFNYSSSFIINPNAFIDCFSLVL